MNSFYIDCYCVVLSTDIPNNKKYILSLDKENIILPKIQLTVATKNSINYTLMDYLKSLNISHNNISLIPQLITLNSPYIDNAKDENINTVYGFLVNYHKDIKDSHWISFDYTEPNKYSNLILEVVQKL